MNFKSSPRLKEAKLSLLLIEQQREKKQSSNREHQIAIGHVRERNF